MSGLRVDDVVPGVVVFGRVLSFPWWPAVVGRCPKSGQWKDAEERRWVFFFNDKNGAWLKVRDMRKFDAVTRETITEINSRNPKHRKHLERIAKACDLAGEYQRTSGRARELSEFSRNLTYSALTTSPPPGDEIRDTPSPVVTVDQAGPRSPSRPSLQPRPSSQGNTLESLFGNRDFPSVKRRRRSSAPSVYDSGLANNTVRASAEPDTVESQTMTDGQRPRRKRKKSTRYQGFDDPFETRSGKPSKEVREHVVEEVKSTQESETPNIPSVILSLQRKDIQPHKINFRGRRAVFAPKPPIAEEPKSWRSDGENATQDRRGSGSAVTVDKKNRLLVRINGSVMTRGQKEGSSSTKAPTNKSPKKLDLKPMRMSKKTRKRLRKAAAMKVLENDPFATASSESEIEPMEGEVQPNNGHPSNRSSLPSNFRTPFRNRETDPFRRDNMDGDSTDTDNNADQVRLLTNTRELHQEAMVEHAIQRVFGTPASSTPPSGSPAKAPKVPPLPLCVAEGALMRKLVSRVSALEEHVVSLQGRVGLGNGVVLGEDATAAALKAAVETMMKAAEEFARCREFEAGTIARSMNGLWPEPEPGDLRAAAAAREQEYARSVARSLVWGVFQKESTSK